MRREERLRVAVSMAAFSSACSFATVHGPKPNHPPDDPGCSAAAGFAAPAGDVVLAIGAGVGAALLHLRYENCHGVECAAPIPPAVAAVGFAVSSIYGSAVGSECRKAHERAIAYLRTHSNPSGAELSRADIDAVVDAGPPLACLRSAFAAGRLSPGAYRLVVDWQIDLEGRVSTVRVQSPPDALVPPLRDCITAAIGQWVFPRPSAGTWVGSYAFPELDLAVPASTNPAPSLDREVPTIAGGNP